jgi:hypothetical protein
MYLLNLHCATFRDVDCNSEIYNIIDTLFEEGLINIGGKTYEVELCIHNNKKYIRSVRPYEEHEFEKMFGFGCKCSGFVKGKTIIVI